MDLMTLLRSPQLWTTVLQLEGAEVPLPALIFLLLPQLATSMD